jgi:phospholipid-binding lipoprotein MlaA
MALMIGFVSGAASLAQAQETEYRDPWEGVNRKIFAFNEGVDRFVFVPVATGWDFVMPDLVQKGIRNFFHNLYMPVTLVNDILQVKPGAVAQDVTRIVMNTAFGIGGLIDVASYAEIPRNDETFGQTLGVYGVPPGPYMVLPFLGPSNPRESFGLVVDTATLPHQYFVPFYITWGGRGLEILNRRAYYLQEIAQSRRDAFDFYIFVRNAYNQNLEQKVRGERFEEESEDDLYSSPDEEDYDYDF